MGVSSSRIDRVGKVPNTLLLGLEKILRGLGDLTLSWRDTSVVQGNWVDSQLKTQADIMAHEYLCNHLKNLSNDIPILSEEGDLDFEHNDRPGCYWLIDPIDGTASFAGGYPGYVVQGALMVDEKPELAGVYAPVLADMYLAERRAGAFLNGKLLSGKEERPGSKTLIDNYPSPTHTANRVFTELGYMKYVECGSLGLKICKIADQTADLFFKDVLVRDWDIAPAHLILSELGGLLLDIFGREYSYAGSYEKPGVIAARSESIVEEFLAFLSIKNSVN